MAAYYNEIDPRACEWIRQCMAKDKSNVRADGTKKQLSPEEVASFCEQAPLEADPDLCPLAPPEPGRVMLLKGAGNAINPHLAAVFIEEFVGAMNHDQPV